MVNNSIEMNKSLTDFNLDNFIDQIDTVVWDTNQIIEIWWTTQSLMHKKKREEPTL